MSYVKLVNYAVKDSLITGDPNKIISGTEINNEFAAIAAASAITDASYIAADVIVAANAAAATALKLDTATAATTYAPLNSPPLTGIPTAPTATVGTNTTQVATMAALINQAFTTGFPSQTGNSGKFLTTNGTTPSWTAPVNDIPIGGLLAFDSDQTGNTVTAGTSTYLKTGVITDASTYPLANSSSWMTTASTAIPTTLPIPSSAAGIIYGNGIWIMSGGGKVSVSTDGVAFGAAITLTGFSASSTSVGFGNGIFVAIDTINAVCATSANGTAWTYGTTTSAGDWCIPVYGASTWVTVKTGTGVMTSTDGLNWTARTNTRTMALSAAYVRPCLAFGAGVFAAICQDSSGLCATSPDGITWTNRTQTAPTTGLINIIFAAGIFVVKADGVAANTIRTSPDGITWTNRTRTASFSPVYFHNGKFAIQENTLVNFVTSPDAITWTAVALTSDLVLNAIYYPYSNGTMAIGIDTINTKLHRSDGVGYWGQVNAVGSAVLTTSMLNYGNSKYMYNTSSGYFNYIGQMSNDGINWWQVHGQGSGNGGGSACIHYFAGLYFICSGVTGYYTTPDLITYTSRTGLIVNNSVLFAANTKIFNTDFLTSSTAYKYSTDGITFNSGTLPSSQAWNGFVYGNGIYLAYSNSTSTATGTDGISWTARTIPVAPIRIVFVNGYFVTCDTAGSFYNSTDGITWTLLPLYGVASTVNGLVAIGNDVFALTATGCIVWTFGGATVARRITGAVPVPVNKYCSVSGATVARSVALNSSTNESYTASTPKVVNDVNLKTYNVTVAEQTNFYKRVA